jgi:hypothetical protein
MTSLFWLSGYAFSISVFVGCIVYGVFSINKEADIPDWLVRLTKGSTITAILFGLGGLLSLVL